MHEGDNLANFRKTTGILFIFLIVLVSLALRYPLVEHERHNDTFFNRLLADSIVKNDYAVWTFHPLSYFGYYPVSYPSGTSFLIAETAEMAGIGLSPSIVAISMFSGILFALSVFCLSRVLLKRVDLCLLAAVLSVLAPRFVDISYWSGSARAPFVALAILAVFVATRTGYSGRGAYGMVLGIVVLGCFVFHHMAVVFVLFLIAYLLSTLLTRITYSFGPRVSLIRTGGWFIGLTITVLGFAAALVAMLYLSNYGSKLMNNYASTSLFSFEPAYFSTLLNMAASYTNQIGLVLPVAVLSLPIYLIRTRITPASLFPVLLIVSFVPLLPSAEYITMILSPFVVILAVAWFGAALKREKNRRIVVALLVVVVCASLVLPVLSSMRWNNIQERSGDPIASDAQLFTDAAYLRDFGYDYYAISNSDVLSRRLAGASGVVFLGSGVPSALSGDVTAESVNGNISWMDQQFPQNLYLLLKYTYGDDSSRYVLRYLVEGSEFPIEGYNIWQGDKEYFEIHSRLLVIVDNRWPDVYIWAWDILPADLPSELKNAQWGVDITYPLQSYSIYVSERITLYATEVPTRHV